MSDTPPSVTDKQRRMIEELGAIFGKRLRTQEPLARHGTLGVGGPADAWVTVMSEDELLRLVELVGAHDAALMPVGNGTNILFADAGARGVVARMALNAWHIEEPDGASPLLVAGAGVGLPGLAKDLAKLGLSGFEWAIGVPGTIGGAVVSNAGANGGCVADTLVTARVLCVSPGATTPQMRTLSLEELALGYRHSRFRVARGVSFDEDGMPIAAPRGATAPLEMIVGAMFRLRRADPAAVRECNERNLQHRLETQPSDRSAGSVFKNPGVAPAGKLIQEAGLKGQRAGGAQISLEHANFIVNKGGATAADVVALIGLARRAVRERCGIELELELELRGDW